MADLIQSRILNEASARERGQWQAASGAWTGGGRMVGLALASVAPWFLRIHLTFGGLSLLTATQALTCTLASRPGACARVEP